MVMHCLDFASFAASLNNRRYHMYALTVVSPFTISNFKSWAKTGFPGVSFTNPAHEVLWVHVVVVTVLFQTPYP